MNLLVGKVALITGASRGIGKSIAESFVAQGAQVAFTYLSSVEKGEALEKELSANGTKVKGYRSDASDFAQANELVENVVADFGKIDILINNAGITKDNLMLRMSEADWDDVLRINLKSAFNMVKAISKPMLKARAGSIINITSVVGVMGNAGQANYAASKAGMIGFTKSIAKEFGARGIRCNAIAPGFIETEMTGELDQNQLDSWLKNIPLKRAGAGTDVANGCTFLASDMSTYVTGQVLMVDGGMVM
ncbi:3-oxoacyl-[acyl-carrier-protein] reductase [Spirosomataceae bacterium TFI 002]|nr:3-oxoacyl-[acyl-carrier-protein] reductase [Spirosomataceae bacterium TFI 002]